MVKFGAASYGELVASMMQMEQIASSSAPLTELYGKEKAKADLLLLSAFAISRAAGLTESQDSARRLMRDFKLPDQCAELQHNFAALRHLMESEMRKQLFFTVSIEDSKLYEQDRLFGDAVYDKFESARPDIKAAGTALACGIGSASVFHLMRASEHGLRALARDRRVKLPKKDALDLATWEAIIQQLEQAEIAIHGYPKTLAREAQFDFYHGAMMEFKRFKNKFRNRIMHTREDYDRDEAHSALAHVRSFMKILASRISETTKTPVIWKGKKWTRMES